MLQQLLGTSPTGVEVRGEGGEKSVEYPERAFSLLRDMESIRYQAEAEETAADDEGGEEEDEDDYWDGKFVNNIQEEGEEG